MIKILLLLLSFNLYAKIDCNQHKIYCHIKRVKPSMKMNLAMNLSNLIYKYSRKYGTNPHVSVAIGRQETNLRMIGRKETIIQFNPEPVYITGYTDICMFQFHSRTIQAEKLDAHKLYTNLEYCVEQHTKLLAKKIRICKKNLGKKAWSCYHSFNNITRKHYYNLVRRYL